jgi:hypothetical protein
MVADMETCTNGARVVPPVGGRMPSHVPTGAVLLALELSEEARGIRGLDVLRRSVDRAPPGIG